MRRRQSIPFLFLVLCGFSVGARAEPAQTNPAPQEAANQKALFEKFKKTLSNATLIGKFTITGQDDFTPKAEKYSIRGVTKMEQGDFWLFDSLPIVAAIAFFAIASIQVGLRSGPMAGVWLVPLGIVYLVLAAAFLRI